MQLTSPLLDNAGVPHGFCDPEAWTVREASMGPTTMPRQVHGARVVHVARLGDRPADGLWDGRGDRALSIRTADCIPLLLATPGRVAAIHAGWRGVAQGIVERFLARQARAGIPPAGWTVALGPAAGGCCYEVGPEVLLALGLNGDGKRRIDLRELQQRRLLALGVRRIELVGPCTICGSEGWASYRRQGERAGRNVAWIRAGERRTSPVLLH